MRFFSIIFRPPAPHVAAAIGAVCGVLGFGLVAFGKLFPASIFAPASAFTGFQFLFTMAVAGCVGIKWRTERGIWMLGALFSTILLAIIVLGLVSDVYRHVKNPALPITREVRDWAFMLLTMSPALWIGITCSVANYRYFRRGWPPQTGAGVPAPLRPLPRPLATAASPPPAP